MPSSEKVISPGIFTNEIDQSFLPAAVSDIGAAIVGPTVKGPAGVPTVVNSYSEFQATFGDTFLSGSDYYTYMTSLAAKNYLRHGSSLLVTRILPTGYSGANTTVSSSTIAGTGTKAQWAITFSAQPSASLSSSAAPDELKIGTTDFTYVDAATTGSLTNTSGQIFVGVQSLSPGAAAQQAVRETREAINNNASTHNLAITASTNGNLILGITASNDGPTYDYDIFYNGTGHWFDSRVVNASGSASTSSGVSFKLHTLSDGTSQNSVSKETTNNILPSGSKNNVRWEVSNVNNKKGTFSLLVRRGDDTIKRKQIMETWNNVSLDPNQNNYVSKIIGDASFGVKDAGTASPFLVASGSYPNKSKYVRVEVIKQTVDYLDENGNIRDANASGSLPNVSSGSFAGGSDGGDNFTHPQSFFHSISNTNTQGLNLGTAAKGKTAYEDALNLLANQDEYDFNLLLMPGVVDSFANHTSVVTKAIDMCETRGDCFVVNDPVPYNSALTTATTQAETRDSNYAAVYWPWVQIQDDERGTPVWVPPSVTMGGIYAFNDKVAQPWFAPAGLNRGGIDVAIQAERKLTQANRDDLYESNVNPIATFPNQGVCVWGQKTMQKKSSALDRINVRRLMIKVKKFIASSSRFLVFEQNNANTRRRFLNIVNPFLEQIQAQSGLSAFRVVMDETNNTPDTIDRNILYGQLFLQPTRTAEFVVLDFTVQPTGATFPE